MILEVIILGCGGSGGTPLATGHWGVCDPNEPRNKRTRPSIAIKSQNTCVVIDTGADFREQTLREDINHIDAIIYTHDHADHVNGFDDVRYTAIKRRINGDEGYKMPIYADQHTLSSIKDRFDYMFKTSTDGLYVPLIEPHEVNYTDGLMIGDLSLRIFSQIHGQGHSMGIRIGNIGYSTDVSALEEGALDCLKGIETWIVDCGQYGSDFITVHPNLDEVLKWNDVVKAKKLYLTHLTPRADYQTINSDTPDNIECAYDGLRLTTNIEF